MTQLLHGDCLDILKTMPDESVDAIVTDPPYGLSFMGKKWDYDVPSEDIWRECLRVLKPGGHLLSFGGSRTYHRLTCAIEDAGFEIRDQIMWLYGSGFPKSHDVSKAIDKDAGIWRGKAGGVVSGNGAMSNGNYERTPKGNPATDAARQWQGWGTALKPAHEPICVARKPLVGTVAANVLAHGTGAINVDGCRVAGADAEEGRTRHGGGIVGNASSYELPDYKAPMPAGRWPANVIHDGSDEVMDLFPLARYGDTDSPARFYYCAKASKPDRGEGNNHPTVKPTDLMRYLVRLVTPPGGVVLDPFMGSGSTGKAAKLEGLSFIGIEREEQYVEIARARIEAAQ